MPSIRAAADEARHTFARFPFVMIAAITAAVTAMMSMFQSDAKWPISVFAAATLGLALFLAIAITAERHGSRRASWTFQLLALLGLVLFAIAWSQWPEALRWRRFAQFGLGFHLLVAFLPYARSREQNGFWQYNRTLFMRFLFAGLYSAILFAGISAALAAIDRLLGIQIDKSVYPRLWILLAFVFNTWFFVGGIPDELSALEERHDYPQGLKAFSQFILIPLVALYLLILTAYLGRIVVTGQWPSGSIGYLVSAVAAIGMLSLLLVHPIRERAENRWVATYAGGFYIALLPAIAMLLIAIWKRIDQYGVTVDRYFIAVLSLWLAGIAVTFIARRNTDIRVIPVTLCLLAFATAFGPIGAYSVSRRSQLSHLRELLHANGLLENGRARAATAPVPVEARRELSSTLVYLFTMHGTASASPVLGDSLPQPESEATVAEWERNRPEALRLARAVMRSLGMEYVDIRDSQGPGNHFSHYAVNRVRAEVVGVQDYDYHVWLPGLVPTAFTIDGVTWEVRAAGRSRTLRVARPGQDAALEFPLDSLIAFARQPMDVSTTSPLPQLEARSGDLRAKLVPSSFLGTVAADTVQLDRLEGNLYLDLRSGAGAEAPGAGR